MSAEDAGARLDRFLASQVLNLSRTRIQELIVEGRAHVNGKPAKAAHKIEEGNKIEIEPAARPPLAAMPEDLPLEILYEDEDVVAINKPAGMTVHLGAGIQSGTLVNALLGRYAKLSSGGGTDRPGIVHRLDKETSGVILVARNDNAHRSLAEQFHTRTVEKTYIALVHGKFSKDAGMIDLPISRDTRRRTRMTTISLTGRAARTSWRVRARIGNFTLVEVGLHTGRTHQIRVHFSALKHPVVGDTAYGAARQIKLGTVSLPELGRNFLHAARICFSHPRTGERLDVRAPLPADLRGFLQRLAVAVGSDAAAIDAALRSFL